MVPYIQPSSGRYDINNKEIDSEKITGFVTGSKWLKCPDICCNHRLEILKPQRNTKVQLAHGKESAGKLFIQTIGKGKKKGGLTETDKELAGYFGGSGVGISKVDEHNYTYSSDQGWTES
jgi:hypothetical protein